MKLIAGLGNPGKEYDKTRHNIGFEVIKDIQKTIGAGDFKNKFKGFISEGKIKNEKVILLMPQTYMNLSGDSIIEALSFYKLNAVTDLIVIYDDMDMPVGKIRIRAQGSAGGHNGMKSIISHVGEKFLRIKCGIDRAKTKEETVNYVLGRFAKSQEKEVADMIAYANAAALDLSTTDNVDNVMNKYN